MTRIRWGGRCSLCRRCPGAAGLLGPIKTRTDRECHADQGRGTSQSTFHGRQGFSSSSNTAGVQRSPSIRRRATVSVRRCRKIRERPKGRRRGRALRIPSRRGIHLKEVRIVSEMAMLQQQPALSYNFTMKQDTMNVAHVVSKGLAALLIMGIATRWVVAPTSDVVFLVGIFNWLRVR